MQSTFLTFFVALFVYGASAQKGHVTIPIVSKAQPTTAPRAIDESDRKKECPAGFKFIGKQCGKTLIEEPNLVCPHGTVLVDGRCAVFTPKNTECPPGYIDFEGICRKVLRASPETVCPVGFILKGKDTCAATIALPPKHVCPPGSIQKGDGCALSKQEAPEYVCPTGYTLRGKKCQREETFDCTPPRVPREIEEESKKEHIRHPAVSKGKESTVYRLPAAQPIVEEYVIKKTCKRLVTEAARPVCAKGGNFNGKMCIIDVMTGPVSKPGGFKEELAPVAYMCPEGFEEGHKGECIAIEDVQPYSFCEAGAIDIGDKCAIYKNPRTTCPTGFFLDGKVCSKTVFAAPLVEYTVTYACTGKDCANGH